MTIEEFYTHIRNLVLFKLEFMDENDNYHQLDSHIIGVYNDYILISPPEKDDIIVNIPENSGVNLIFPSSEENKVLIAQCSVFGREFGDISGIRVSHPYNAQVIERREYVRVPMKLRTDITFHLKPDGSEEKTLSAISKNISGNGVAVFHKEPVEDYCKISCIIHLKDGGATPVRTDCDIIYTRKVRIKEETYNLTALAFTSILEQDLSRIVKECFKYQINNKKIRKY